MISKNKIAASFSQAAQKYDASAQFQRDVGRDLLALLPKNTGGCVLDLGSGTGALHPLLRAHLQPDISVNSDLAHGMNTFARAQTPTACDTHWVTADAENMPFGANSFDHIFANLSLQWCQDIQVLAAEVNRVLQPKGTLWYSTLIPGTLRELADSWAVADDFPHVNQFVPTGAVLAQWHQSGFEQIVCHHKTYQLQYDSPLSLLHDLKGIGAHFMDSSANKKVTSPGALKRMLAAYREFQTAAGRYPATYEVLMLGLRKP